MRRLMLSLALLALCSGVALAEQAFLQCRGLPESPGPFGDGTAAGELFGIYAAEINPDVLIYPQDLREPAPSGFDFEEAHVRGEGWFDPYATEGPGT